MSAVHSPSSQEQIAALLRQNEELSNQLKAIQIKNAPLPKGEYYRLICSSCLEKVDILREKWVQNTPQSPDGKWVYPQKTTIRTTCPNCEKSITFHGGFGENVQMRRIFVVTSNP